MRNLANRTSLGRGSLPLSAAYTGKANSFGFLRLVFAYAVVVAHTAVIGFAHPLDDRIDVPGLGVAGFFGISGFLITRSARRNSLPRYLWHRALRIWPGLWACLLFTVLVLVPLVWYATTGSAHGIWRGPGGSVSYLQQNWWGGHRQAAIGTVFRDTPYGRLAHRSVVNGSLWTLAYEIFCYVLVATAAVVGILRRARWLALLATVATFGVLTFNQFEALRQGAETLWTSGSFGPLPGLGSLITVWFLRYGFMFLAGATAELYSDRLPMHDGLGVLAVAVVVWCVLQGQLFGPGLLAYEYAILWLAIRLPRDLHRVGQRNDYSYGVYIYTFPAQQALAAAGLPRYGFAAYLAASALTGFGLAWLSWHTVEKQALRLKDWSPTWPWHRRGPDREATGLAAEAPVLRPEDVRDR